MAIIVNEHSKVIIQGITGSVGKSFAERMVQYGTPLVGGVTPGKGGQSILDVPVFNSVQEVVYTVGADTSFVCVRPSMVKQAVLEAIDAGIRVIIIYSEGVPIHDSMVIVQYAKLHGVTLLGPNSAGLVSPGKANVSDLHDSILVSGRIGVVSRSGTLTYEVVDMLKLLGLGASTVVCLGGDPVIGTQHFEVLSRFRDDDETDAVIYIGEIGGVDEVLSAQVIQTMDKPVYAYIAGRFAPAGKRMGHAGAIIQSQLETAVEKQRMLQDAGAIVVDVFSDFFHVIK
jgi:succinyl-CoA synthetase alpha subunit